MFLGSTSRPPKFDGERDTWPILENDVFGFVGYKGCKDALVVATSDPVMVADDIPFLTRIGCQGTRLMPSNVLRWPRTFDGIYRHHIVFTADACRKVPMPSLESVE